MAPLRFNPVQVVRHSFRWKLLVALLTSVALLAVITLIVVRSETARQVEFVTRQADQRSQHAFLEIEQHNRTQLSQLSTVFTGSVQAAAALEAALEAHDYEALFNDVVYELEARHIPHSLIAFTDAYGEPVLGMLDRAILDGDDPVGVRQPAEHLLLEAVREVRGYRAVNGRLFSVETLLLDLGRPIGTVTVGVPITDADARSLGSVIGAEVCFLVDGRCVAGTDRARGGLQNAFAQLAGRSVSTRAEIEGERWQMAADRVSAGEDRVWRVIAVPLDPVVMPFERVQRALVFGSLGALTLAILLATALSRSLTRPVRALLAATSRIGSGDFSARVTVRSVDELGALGNAFNDMAAGLALKEHYRGVLDKVVSRDIAEELLRGDIALGGENREVTVLFGDITGFTRITEGMDPARVVALLNECMELLTAAVEAEGGVVDKYVGDEIMALFGAPISRPDDTMRAVRAALGMQRAMRLVNNQREERGEARLGLSIGMNTGEVMAGNMGSPNRLNYTVLGDAVNLAARVVKAADGDEILLTGNTVRLTAPHIRVREIGTRELRGFSQPVNLFELIGLADDAGEDVDRARVSRVASAASHLAAPLIAALLFVAPPLTGALHAQMFGELPTLESLVITSRGGAFQLGFSGRFDVEGFLPQSDPAWIIPSTSPFVAPRLRLVSDAFFGDHVIGSIELRVDGGEAPRAGHLDVRVDQLFLRVIPTAAIAAQAGRFVTPFGGWPQRHHTMEDPFIRPPLSYDYRTILNAGKVPPSGREFLNWKDSPEQFRVTGAPAVWGAPYPWGAMLMGKFGRFDWRGAVLNSSPSSDPSEWGLRHGFSAPSFVAGAGAQIVPALRLALSYNIGPWLREDATGLPPGRDAADWDQRILGAEAVFRYGRTKLRGELLHNTWGVPNVGTDVVDVSWYAEAEQTVSTAVTMAVRAGAIHFLDLNGAAAPWDYDMRRLQLSAGYRVARNAGVRAELMVNSTTAPVKPRDNLAALQLWWTF